MELQLRQMREANGYTQKELADKIGATLRKISSWENSEVRIPFADAARIADVFDCSLDELAGRDFRREQTELSADERDLIGLYRDAGTEGQHIVMRTAEGAAEAFDRGGTPETLLPPPRLRKVG